jgi:dUTP pyrophosphatase
MKIKIKKVSENAQIPKKAHNTDACFDVFASEIKTKSASGVETVVVKLGFSTEIPEGYKGILVPRSSLTDTTWMMQNSPGQIDESYRGEYQMRFKQLLCFNNDTKDVFKQDFPYKVGDRVGQVYFEKVLETEFEVVKELSDSERGSGGFGSSGK